MVDEAAKQGKLDFAKSTPVVEKEESKKKKIEQEQQIAALTHRYKVLVIEKQDRQDKIIARLVNKFPTLYEDIANAKKGKITNSYNYDLSAEENMKHPSIGAFINNGILEGRKRSAVAPLAKFISPNTIVQSRCIVIRPSPSFFTC